VSNGTEVVDIEDDTVSGAASSVDVNDIEPAEAVNPEILVKYTAAFVRKGSDLSLDVVLATIDSNPAEARRLKSGVLKVGAKGDKDSFVKDAVIRT
jgi:hypothetical protein